jgi:N-terminal acetyltransferase B complex catalytic subunit
VIYRTVLDYYSGEEHAHDMRKPLRRDEEKRSIEGRGHSIRPQQLGPDFGGS